MKATTVSTQVTIQKLITERDKYKRMYESLYKVVSKKIDLKEKVFEFDFPKP